MVSSIGLLEAGIFIFGLLFHSNLYHILIEFAADRMGGYYFFSKITWLIGACISDSLVFDVAVPLRHMQTYTKNSGS